MRFWIANRLCYVPDFEMISHYLITCDHARARHDYIRNHLNGIFNQNWQVVFAPDHRAIQADTDHLRKHISLTQGYLQTLHTALFKGGNDDIMIMEDDVNFLPYSLPVLDLMISELPDDFDLCYLTKTFPNNDGAVVLSYSDSLYKVFSNWWETPITLWSRKFAKEFLRYADWKMGVDYMGNIDHELNKMNEQTSEWPEAKAYNFYGSKQLTAYGLSTKEGGMASVI